MTSRMGKVLVCVMSLSFTFLGMPCVALADAPEHQVASVTATVVVVNDLNDDVPNVALSAEGTGHYYNEGLIRVGCTHTITTGSEYGAPLRLAVITSFAEGISATHVGYVTDGDTISLREFCLANPVQYDVMPASCG